MVATSKTKQIEYARRLKVLSEITAEVWEPEPTPYGYSVEASVQAVRPELCKLVHPREQDLYNRCRSSGVISLFGEAWFLKQVGEQKFE